MRARVKWSPKARLELAVIWNYIKRDSEGNALQVLRDIGSVARRLKEHPLSGRMVPEWKRPDVRELIVGSYRMMYSLITKTSLSLACVTRGGGYQNAFAENGLDEALLRKDAESLSPVWRVPRRGF